MKNICNIFNPINKTNGNFLLFSQYVDDVSKSVVDSSYKVRPSKFMCLNFDEDIQSNAAAAGSSSEPTEYIPMFLQNHFENGITALKDQNLAVTPFNFSLAFLEKLIELTAKEDDNSINLNAYIKYIGAIDLESWENGFADIILDINTGTSSDSIPGMVDASIAESIGGVSVPTDVSIFNTDFCGSQSYSNIEGEDSQYYIHGWVDSTDLPLSPIVEETDNIGPGYNKTMWGENNESVFNKLLITAPSEDTEFTFNTILVFYDILDENNVKMYEDIPMGVYFTGEGTNDGIDNSVTIYKSSELAYGAGSGWALRICTKFSPTPYGNLQVEEVALESKSITNSISALMSATAEVIKTVNDFASESIYNSQTIKDLYSIFKNSRTNVPYPKEVNGRQYWFVNGRNTEVPCTV